MTKCNTKNEFFQVSNGRKIEFNFKGGNISSDGGLLQIKEFDKKMQITKLIGSIVNSCDEREKGKIKHTYAEMIKQRIFAIIAGEEDLNDHNDLRNDLIMQTALDKHNPLSSPSTLCRFENKIPHDICVQLSSILVENFIESFQSEPEELILDFDSTDSIIYGDQEAKFFHGYYDDYCYLPLYVTCGEQLLISYLRPSNIDGAKHAWAILALLVKRIRQVWKNTKIIFRADSGFCRQNILNWCDKNNVYYIVGIPSNNRLNELTKKLQEQAKNQYEDTNNKVKIYDEFNYSAKSWTHQRRVIVKAEYNILGANTRYIVTNLDEEKQYLYETVYCARGNMENKIKEQQLNLFADRMSCHYFTANQFRLLLSSFAYLILERYRALILNGTEYAKATCGRIRLDLIKIGAVIRMNTRKIYISYSSSYPHQELINLISQKILALE